MPEEYPTQMLVIEAIEALAIIGLAIFLYKLYIEMKSPE